MDSAPGHRNNYFQGIGRNIRMLWYTVGLPIHDVCVGIIKEMQQQERRV
jgi:hypothetical protein